MDLIVILSILLKTREVTSESVLNPSQLFNNALEVEEDEYIVKPVEDKPLLVAVDTKLALLELYKKGSVQRNTSHSDANSCRCRGESGDEGSPPQLDKALSVHKEDWFSIFEEDHKQGVMELKNYLMEATAPEELVAMCYEIRNSLNDHLFLTALTNVLLYKKYDIDLPPVMERFPTDFIERSHIEVLAYKDKEEHGEKGAHQERKNRQMDDDTVDFERLPNGNYRITRVADLSGNDPFPENRVSYFREDYGMNSHHYNWHRVNLGDTPRRDDYFIYMHQQMLARYNAERLSNNLPRVEPYSNMRRPIEVGHEANLGHDNRRFADRPHNTIPADYADIGLLELLRGYLDYGIRQEEVDDEEFFHVLERYHDRGHIIISEAVEDEDGRGSRNVMIDSPASARDNIFFRWHQHIHDLFEQYQGMKRRATHSYLTYDDLLVPHFQVWDMQLTSHQGTRRVNELVTGCSYHTMEATNGLDFRGNERAYVHLTHLDHVPFTYHILVHNSLENERRGIIRLFLAPRNNELGTQMDIEDQRHFWIELDKYLYTFHPGVNYIRRRSTSSSVSVNCRDTYEDIAERVQTARELVHSGHCGCGWPQHLLLPRGTEDGMPFTIFIIVTDEHHIQPQDWRLGRSTYCGIPNVDLPDHKPMGFPFHAPAPGISPNSFVFASTLANAFSRGVTIRFSGYQTDENETSISSCRHPGRG